MGWSWACPLTLPLRGSGLVLPAAVRLRLGRVSTLPPRLPQESREQGLQQRLLDEQLEVLRRSAAEAERMLQDAVGTLDDPLHLRCTSSPGRAPAGHSATFPPGQLAGSVPCPEVCPHAASLCLQTT